MGDVTVLRRGIHTTHLPHRQARHNKTNDFRYEAHAAQKSSYFEIELEAFYSFAPFSGCLFSLHKTC